jgi:hypothetical protein
MEDVNVSNDLKQLSHGQVKALEYSRSDINRYYFRMVKLEASHPLATTTNNRVVTSGEDAIGHVTDYYGICQGLVPCVLWVTGYGPKTWIRLVPSNDK